MRANYVLLGLGPFLRQLVTPLRFCVDDAGRPRGQGPGGAQPVNRAGGIIGDVHRGVWARHRRDRPAPPRAVRGLEAADKSLLIPKCRCAKERTTPRGRAGDPVPRAVHADQCAGAVRLGQTFWAKLIPRGAE